MSKALQTLKNNMADLDHLLEIHEHMTGSRRGRRGRQATVLNRSGIVLGCAAWEAYLEDVCSEACDFLRRKARSERAIPDGIKYAVIETLREKRKDSAIGYWRLSDERWRRSAIRIAAAQITERFQNPSAKKSDALLEKCLALRTVSKSWGARARRLDGFVDLRHSIAHGTGPKAVHKKKVQDFQSLLVTLGEKVDRQVADHVEDLLVKERAALKQAAQRRPGRRPKEPKSRRGRPEKLRPW